MFDIEFRKLATKIKQRNQMEDVEQNVSGLL